MKKFLIGCGITVLVLAVLGFGASFYLVNKVKQELAVGEQVEARREQLREELGEPDTYVPGGIFDPVRFATYLEIREAVHDDIGPHLAEAESRLRRAENQTGDGGFVGKIRGLSEMMRGGVGALKVGLSAMAVRDSLLLQAQMPEGEYIYYHCLAVHSWLEWTPPERSDDTGLLDDRDWEKVVRESREELRALYLEILGNLAAALDAGTELTEEEDAVRAALDEHLDRRWRNTEEWPLQGVLPESTVAALSPFETRLRTTLPRTTVEFFVDTMATHLSADEDHGGVQVQFD